jgi:hypothetical protein
MYDMSNYTIARVFCHIELFFGGGGLERVEVRGEFGFKKVLVTSWDFDGFLERLPSWLPWTGNPRSELELQKKHS